MRPSELLVLVTARLGALGIAYCVGGSFASSAYGRARTTFDLDLLIDPQPHELPALVAAFQTDFALSADELVEAAALAPTYAETPERRAIAKAYHRATQFRVDFFLSSGRAFERSQLARAAPQVVATDTGAEALFSSPEDITLAKLEWFRLGGYASTNQWLDIQAILQVQGARLDWPYLRAWAGRLGVDDLLNLAASGGPKPSPPGADGGSSQLRLID